MFNGNRRNIYYAKRNEEGRKVGGENYLIIANLDHNFIPQSKIGDLMKPHTSGTILFRTRKLTFNSLRKKSGGCLGFLSSYSVEKTAKYSSSLQRIKLGAILPSTKVAHSLSFPVVAHSVSSFSITAGRSSFLPLHS